MVAPAPNLTALCGRLLARRPSARFSGWDDVDLAVEQARPVDGLPSRVAASDGDTVTVAVRPELLGDAAPGAQVRLRAALTPRGLRAEPHPPDGCFEVRAVSADGPGPPTPTPSS